MPLDHGRHPNGGRKGFIAELERRLVDLRYDLDEALAREELAQCAPGVLEHPEIHALRTMGLYERSRGSDQCPNQLHIRMRAIAGALEIMRAEA